ncbi:MAG: S24 family peptidase [Desulfovibrionaceae bacterium]
MASDKGFDAFFRRVTSETDVESQSDLARVLGVGRAAVSLAKRKDMIPSRWVLELSGRYGLDPGWLESGRGEPRSGGDPMLEEFITVPRVVARLSAGGGSFETEGRIEGHYAFRGEWLRSRGRPESMVIMQVVGNSMEPEIHDGDLALVDQSKQNLLAGGIYAVGVEDTVLVKRIEKLPGQLVLHSDNTDYSPVRLSGDELDSVRIIGKVIWTCRDYH